MRTLVRTFEPMRHPGVDSRLHLSGTVVLKVLITELGEIDRAELESGHPMSVDPALRAILRSKFQAWVKDGVRRPACGRLKIRFRFANGVAESALD